MVLLTQYQLGILSQARIGYLATADSTASPHVIPICFVHYHQRIYSLVDKKPKQTKPMGLRRIKNILENPRVALVVGHYDDDWSKIWHLLIIGRASILESGSELRKARRQLRHKYPQYALMDIDSAPVIQITPMKLIDWSHSG